MTLFRLSQKLCQSRDVHVAESSSGKSRLDFLQQPTVAIRVAERGERDVTAPLWIRAADRRLSRAGTVKHFANVSTVTDEFGPRCLDVGHDEIQTACRARRGRRQSSAEVDRARRARRRELYNSKIVADGEVGIEPPTQITVKALGAIDVRDRDDDDLKLHVDRARPQGLDRGFTPHFSDVMSGSL